MLKFAITMIPKKSKRGVNPNGVGKHLKAFLEMG
jgi:hypothetical protein